MKDRRALEQVGRLVVALQDKDGPWRVLEDALGSPATHGTVLATHLARRTLQRIDAGRPGKEAIAKADDWLRKTSVDTALDAGAVLLALGKAADPRAVAQKRRCLERIRKGALRTGGWG